LGASKVLLTGITPDAAKNSKVKRTAMNSKIDVSYEKNAYDKILELKEEGYKIISIEKTPGATDIAHYKEKIPCVVIFGNEEFGVSDDVLSLSDEILFIPLYGNKNSLNVSVSSGIALYHISKNFTA
jgi:tRNA G18 (ribose-2'-O)-methylase SpoU